MYREELHIDLEPGHTLFLVLKRRKGRVHLVHAHFTAHPHLSMNALIALWHCGHTACDCPSTAVDITRHPTLLTQFGWCASFLKYLGDRIEVREKRNKRGT